MSWSEGGSWGLWTSGAEPLGLGPGVEKEMQETAGGRPQASHCCCKIWDCIEIGVKEGELQQRL